MTIVPLSSFSSTGLSFCLLSTHLLHLSARFLISSLLLVSFRWFFLYRCRFIPFFAALFHLPCLAIISFPFDGSLSTWHPFWRSSLLAFCCSFNFSLLVLHLPLSFSFCFSCDGRSCRRGQADCRAWSEAEQAATWPRIFKLALEYARCPRVLKLCIGSSVLLLIQQHNRSSEGTHQRKG